MASKITNERILQTSKTAAEWTAANPILGDGEIGFENDTKKIKIGNGSTAYNSLAYYDSRPYKVYTAIINNSDGGEFAAVITVLENTLGGIPVWSQLGVSYGTFRATLSSAFTIGKTFLILSPRIFNSGVGEDVRLTQQDFTADTVEFTISNDFGFYSPYASNVMVEIRVYP